MRVSLTHEFLEHSTDRDAEATLIVDGAKQATYGEIESGANRIANSLLDMGIQRGDRVGLLAANSQQYVETYYGILKAGAVVVALNAAANWPNHRKLLDLCSARGLVCGDRMLRNATGLTRLESLEFLIAPNDVDLHQASVRSSITTATLDHIQNASRDDRPQLQLTGCDRAAIVYTSGSTGDPKGVVLQHGNLVSNTQSIVRYLGLRASDRMLVVLPFHYVYGKSLLNTHVAVGASLAIENRFSFPQRALDTLASTAATGFAGVPSTFAILLNRSNFAERDFPHLRYVTQAGGAMAPPLLNRLRSALGEKSLYVMYGATEASARLAYLDPADLHRKTGSIGRAIPGVSLRVLRDDGSEANVGEVGELVAAGPNIMEGYWNEPEATNEVLGTLGYHTGDLVWRDDEGFLYVVGRKREMIKSGAHRIAPREIEEVILEHPKVHETAVIGFPDEILGESILAFVSLRKGDHLVANDIIRWCRARLPAFKVPHKVHFQAELNRTANGKIDKRALVAGSVCRQPSTPQMTCG